MPLVHFAPALVLYVKIINNNNNEYKFGVTFCV